MSNFSNFDKQVIKSILITQPVDDNYSGSDLKDKLDKITSCPPCSLVFIPVEGTSTLHDHDVYVEPYISDKDGKLFPVQNDSYLDNKFEEINNYQDNNDTNIQKLNEQIKYIKEYFNINPNIKRILLMHDSEILFDSELAEKIEDNNIDNNYSPEEDKSILYLYTNHINPFETGTLLINRIKIEYVGVFEPQTFTVKYNNINYIKNQNIDSNYYPVSKYNTSSNNIEINYKYSGQKSAPIYINTTDIDGNKYNLLAQFYFLSDMFFNFDDVLFFQKSNFSSNIQEIINYWDSSEKDDDQSVEISITYYQNKIYDINNANGHRITSNKPLIITNIKSLYNNIENISGILVPCTQMVKDILALQLNNTGVEDISVYNFHSDTSKYCLIKFNNISSFSLDLNGVMVNQLVIKDKNNQTKIFDSGYIIKCYGDLYFGHSDNSYCRNKLSEQAVSNHRCIEMANSVSSVQLGVYDYYVHHMNGPFYSDYIDTATIVAKTPVFSMYVPYLQEPVAINPLKIVSIPNLSITAFYDEDLDNPTQIFDNGSWEVGLYRITEQGSTWIKTFKNTSIQFIEYSNSVYVDDTTNIKYIKKNGVLTFSDKVTLDLNTLGEGNYRLDVSVKNAYDITNKFDFEFSITSQRKPFPES